jgi:uncharacterized protein (DUF2235 family)
MPRRIVLLSDGTGNSSAQVWRTNVWRMFYALDMSNDEQVACYDDGVGTSSFKPLAILGGASESACAGMFTNSTSSPAGTGAERMTKSLPSALAEGRSLSAY